MIQMSDVSIHARHIGRAIPQAVLPDTTAQFVSIHARHIGRAIQAGVQPLRQPAVCFNPRPTHWSGDTYITEPVVEAFYVSIHARHIGRAIRQLGRGRRSIKPFQSTPDTLVGRYNAALEEAMSKNLFQSTPDTLVGRYVIGHG